MLFDDTINVILCLWVMFSALNVLIVLRDLIWADLTKNDRCLIKTIKPENITHKRSMT